MTDETPSTPRPKRATATNQGAGSEPDPGAALADTQPNFDELFALDETRRRNPLGAASTLIWLAHTTLLEVSEGTRTSAEEWKVTRAIVESVMRYLVLAQAQRIVDAPAADVRSGDSPLLSVLRQLASFARRSKGGGSDGEHVWQLGRRLELVVQCLFDWNAAEGAGVGSEEVFALARELLFVYRDLQPLAGRN